MSDGEFCFIMIFLGFIYCLPYLIIFLPTGNGNNFETSGPKSDVICAYSCCYKFIHVEYDTSQLPIQLTCPHSHCLKPFIISEDFETRTPVEYELYRHKIDYISTLEGIQDDLGVPTRVRDLIEELEILEINSSDNASVASYTFSSKDRKDEIIEELASIGHKSAISALVFILKDRSTYENALKAIGQIGGERAVEIMQKIMELPEKQHFESGIYNSPEYLHVEIKNDGSKSYYPNGIKDEVINALSEMKEPGAVEPLVKGVILKYNHYRNDELIEKLDNFKSQANKKLSEYILDRNKLENQVFQKKLNEEEHFLVESYILKAIGATGGSENPAIRNLSIRGVISSIRIDSDDIKLIDTFKTKEELVKALDQNEYVLEYYKKSEYDYYNHIYYYFPKNKHTNEEINTIVRASIVQALGRLWHRKASDTIIKLMKNVEVQEIGSEYKLRLIKECVKTLSQFKLKKALKPIKDIKKFCEKDYDNFDIRHDVSEQIHEALALLGERESIIHIVRKFKSDETDSKIKRIIRDIDTDKLGEVFDSLELFDDAEKLYTKNGMLEKSAEMRKKKAKMSGSKTVVQGDYVDERDTIVKDSVINRSNIGPGDKFTKLERLAEMKKEGLIDDDEFKHMKKEIMKN